eukprot:7266116-Lingulodinium_polyedra.AAC.1
MPCPKICAGGHTTAAGSPSRARGNPETGDPETCEPRNWWLAPAGAPLALHPWPLICLNTASRASSKT